MSFSDGQSEALTLVGITGNGFLIVDSTFTVRITGVQYLGAGVTEPPKVSVGQSTAHISVPPLAANTQLSFTTDQVHVDEGRMWLKEGLV